MDRFVDGGFRLPHAKQDVAWEDAHHLLISTEWTPGDLTSSAYAYIVKRLTRGQPLSAAGELFRGDKARDVGVTPSVMRDGRGNQISILQRSLDSFRSETTYGSRSGGTARTIRSRSG